MNASVLAGLAAALALWLLERPLARARADDRGLPMIGPAAAVLGATCLALPAAVLAPMLVVAPALLVVRWLWRRRREALAAEARAVRTVEVCDLLAAELAAGRTSEAALEEAAAAWPVLRPVADACRLGGDVPGAFRAAARTPGAGELRLLGAAWAVSHRTGAGLRVSTRRVADAVRGRQATRAVVTGELASARATARLMAALPVVALLMGSGAGGTPWAFLLGTSWGLACLAAGLLLGLAGLWWIELIARDVDR
jgi:tight adherence protein B